MAGPANLGEKAWRAFETHQRSCLTCYDLPSFQKLPPVATGEALPDELCAKGRTLLDLWLSNSTALA